MSTFFRLVCDFEVLTPMFLGGADPISADPQRAAELRAPSIKGAMRFWYRAFDPKFKERERMYFGTGGENGGQSRLIVRCRTEDRAQKLMTWNEINQGIGRQPPNGLVYLGFPFGMKGNERRRAIPPGARFAVEVSCHRSVPGQREHGPTPLHAALASMWSLGHFGALGTRARRGFGAIALTGWRLEGREEAALPDTGLKELPLLHRASTISDWVAGAHQGIATLKRWFGAFEQKDRLRHPCFGPKTQLVVWTEHQRGDWRGALLALGQEFQNARQRQPPDYAPVKDHVRFKSDGGGRHIEQMPVRATFGLPLTFRYRSLPHGKPVTFAPISGERHGSLLFLRPVLAHSVLFGLFLRLDGDVPGIDVPAGLRGASRPLRPAARNAMDEFIRKMKERAGQ